MVADDEPSDGHVSRVSIETLPEGGIRIDDRIDRRNYTIRTDSDVSPEEVDTDRFRYPTDIAVAITTDHLEFVPTGASMVHHAESSTALKRFESEEFPEGVHTVEMSGPLKMYAEITGPCTVENRVDVLTVDLKTADRVVLGARSEHERPAATVTTTDEPLDVMRAVSTFGTELKTQDSRRSYPTLRGHPPAIRVGSELSIPAELEPSDGPITIEVPLDLEYVLPVAPLAYYLGARVRYGERPAVVVDGDRYSLEGRRGFEATVERTLKRTFFLDTLVRNGDQRTAVLHERRALEDAIDIDPEALFGRPEAERFKTYVEVPYEQLEAEMPNWELTAHVRPTTTSIEAVPFLANDLAAVRIHDDPPESASDDGSNDGAGFDGRAEAGDVVRVPSADSVDQAWVGPGIPVGASKTVPEAYRNWQAREPNGDSAVEVAVVCNDEEMLEEGDTAREAYGSNLTLPFEVTLHDDLDTESLRLILESDLDYVHYVGHVDDGGFECADGTLDVGRLDDVGVDIAFLNACQSYEQGYKLIQKGAVAAVVTFDEVFEEGALRLGKTMSRLLNRGFPLRRALSVARNRSIVGSQYLVLGDGNADIAQAKRHIPWVTEAEAVGPDGYRLRITPHPTRSAGMGSIFRPDVGPDSMFLVPKTLPETVVSTDRLRDYFGSDRFPVIIDGTFTWSGDAVEKL